MEHNKKDSIADALGIDPLNGEITEDLPAETQTEDTNLSTVLRPGELESDFEYARTNLYDVIEKGVDGLMEMLDIAKQSQEPRAFEVVALMMKTLSDTNKDLLKVSKEKNEPSTNPGNKGVTNNNLFVGSTAELQKLLKKAKGDD